MLALVGASRDAPSDLLPVSRRLADKLAAEAAAYQEELKGLATTPDQRRAALEKRATELFNKRESERASYAAEAAYRSWRERSDDLRTADTLARAREAAQMQLEQMQVRRRGEAEEAAKELEWAALSERERQRAEARHQAEVAARVKYMKEIKAIRDSQLEDIAQARQLNAAARAREITALKAKWAADDAAADAAARAAIQAAKDRAEVLAKANAERLAAKAAIRAAERALDDAIAAAAVRKAQEEEAAERLLVEAKKNSDAAYRTELAASRQRKAESEAHWEAVMQAHNAAVNAARDAAKRKEDEARAALMADVMATNAAQLQHKAQLRAEAEEAERQNRQESEADFRRMQEERFQGALDKRHGQIERRADIDVQVATRNALAQAQRDADAAADRLRAEAEEAKEVAMRAREAQNRRRGALRVDPASLPPAGVPRLSQTEPSPRTSFARKSIPWMT